MENTHRMREERVSGQQASALDTHNCWHYFV